MKFGITGMGAILIAALLNVTQPALAVESPYDHLHLCSPDPNAAAEWYIEHMGAEKMDVPGRVAYGDVVIVWFKRDAGFPGSEGSAVDHVGFSFHDLAAKMKSYEEAGVKITGKMREIPGKFKFGFVEDPWGTKIEVMEDHQTLGFHHIHLKSPDPKATFDWYEKAFGGERARYYDVLDAIKYGPVWLMVQKSGASEELAPTQDRAIDHLGWGFADLEKEAVRLKDSGVNFTLDPRPFRDLKIAFIDGPDGVRIELVQRPPK